jgi:hypothetical protein
MTKNLVTTFLRVLNLIGFQIAKELLALIIPHAEPESGFQAV